MKHILTTVGTSLFIKGIHNPQDLDRNKFNLELFDIQNDVQNNELNRIINHYKKSLEDYLRDNPKSACAEIKSIDKIDINNNAKIYLICTETILSYLCGIVLKEYYGDRAELEYVKGLQVKNAILFQNTGFLNLFEVIKKICAEVQGQKVFNISGGYKAIIPAMTILAQLEKASICYIFEESDEIIEIANLPMSFDWEIIERQVVNLHNPNKRLKAPSYLRKELVDLKLMNPDDNDLTIIGQLISKYSNKASPLTSTIFGYFIEYKFHEMLSNKYGGHKVEHSVKLKGLNSSDIDILVTPQPNEYIAIEIKPGNVLQDELSMEKIGKNMCLRTKGLIDERTGKILEIWLVVYSLGLNKEQDLGKYLLNEEEKNNICSLEKIIKDCHEFPVLLRVKHYIIKSNRLREDRHIYQNFMRNPINIEEINDLFPFDLDN